MVSGTPEGAKNIFFMVSGTPGSTKNIFFEVSGTPEGTNNIFFGVSGTPEGANNIFFMDSGIHKVHFQIFILTSPYSKYKLISCIRKKQNPLIKVSRLYCSYSYSLSISKNGGKKNQCSDSIF